MRVKLKNFGKTPAGNVRAHIQHGIWRPPGLVNHPSETVKDGSSIAPGDRFCWTDFFIMDRNIVSKLILDNMRLQSEITVSYVDCFGVGHVLTSVYQSNATDDFGFVPGTREVT
jgi:hypothetical protein